MSKVINTFKDQDEEKHISFYCTGCHKRHWIPTAGPKAWQFNGDYEKPTITPSIMVNRGRTNPKVHQCHVQITDGWISFYEDCSHDRAGKKFELEDSSLWVLTNREEV